MKPTTARDVLSLIDASTVSAALGTAMELGLFQLLGRGPKDVDTVAQTLGIPPTRCGYWLQLLGGTGLIDRTPDGFAPSATARAAILGTYSQESWSLLAQEARERLPAVQDLTAHIREPGSTWEAQSLKPPDYVATMENDPERARRFTRMLYEIHQPLAHLLAASLDMTGVARVMDLGGGSGVASLALLRQNPQLNVVVVDIPNVCAAGREIAAENSMENRLLYHTADFLRDDLPQGFDMVLECDVNVYSEDLFGKVRASLNPGGRFVIADQFAPTDGVAHPSRVHWAFQASMMRPDFRQPTPAMVTSLLEQSGFSLLSRKGISSSTEGANPHVLDFTVIEACSAT